MVRRNVIWLADTNYRIDLDNEPVRSLVQAGDFDALVAVDQVRDLFITPFYSKLTFASS